MQFKTIDQMSGRWRLWHHEKGDHLAVCLKCDELFISYTHATVHLYQNHDVRYGVPDRSPTKEELLPVRGNFSNQQEAPAQEAITKASEPNTRLKVQDKASEVQRANIIYEKQLNYLSDCNAAEEHSREKEMKVPEGQNGVQQEENSYEVSKRMDHDNTNSDMIVEDKSTYEPAVNIYEEYSREKEKKVLEGENGVQQEENSYETSKRMDIDDTNGDMITEDSSTNEPSVILSKEVPRTENNDEAVVETRHEVSSYNKNSKLPEDFDSEETYEEKDITIDVMSTVAEVVTGIEDTNKVAVTVNRDTACDDNIENSRNYSEEFLNDQINEFDIKDRVKAEIENKTQKESKEVIFKEKKSSVYRCSDCDFTTNYLQDLENHTNSIHEGLKKYACNAHDHVSYYSHLVQSHQKTKLKDRPDRVKRIGCEACAKNLPHKRCRVNSFKQSTSSWRKKKQKLKGGSSNMNNCEKCCV